MSSSSFPARTATTPLRRTPSGFRIEQIGRDIPSLIGFLAVQADRSIANDRKHAGEMRMAKWILTNVLKSAVDEALRDPDAVGTCQEFHGITDRCDPDYEGRDLYTHDQETKAWLNYRLAGRNPDAIPDGNTGSSLRLWCEALDLDPEFIGETALDLIDMIADEARANPDRERPDATIPQIMDIDTVKMLFDNLPVEYRERANVIRLRAPKSNDNYEQFDFFKTA